MCVTNTPELNIQYDPVALIKKYEREIKELKQELSMHDTLSNRSHVQHEPFTEPQKLELQKQVKAFLENEDVELEVKHNVRELLFLLRPNAILDSELATNQRDISSIPHFV